ncbi:MAG: methyltransferase domain-containing protein [Patescibacteria group bacterium]|nr:methyltransferase domain-containing protein [Patescibacteria group bacterium]
MKTTIYTERFFKENSSYSLKSAKVMVPLILKLLHPKSIVDVGCGTGDFLYIFQKNGVKDILGIDGDYVNKKKLLIPKKLFLETNLEKPLNLKRKFDLVISLEVAEHLSEKYAKQFIKTLTNLGSIVLFSAAIPLQGGTHHINEQWPEYWVKIFARRNYLAIDCFRKKIWNNKKVSFWYAQNTLLFVKKDLLQKNLILKKEFELNKNSILSVVHPRLFLFKLKHKKTF